MDLLRDQVTDDLVIRFQEADALLHSVEVEGDKETRMTSEAIAVFFYVAAHDGCHKQAMERDLGISVAAGSRNTDLLSKLHRLRLSDGKPRPGLDLIIKKEDPTDRRRQILTLSIKGKKLIHQFKTSLYGENFDMGGMS